MQKELATLAFSFGPNNKHTLYMPMTRNELAQSLQQLARVLLEANAWSPSDMQKNKAQNPDQLTFNWGDPICGSGGKIPA